MPNSLINLTDKKKKETKRKGNSLIFFLNKLHLFSKLSPSVKNHLFAENMFKTNVFSIHDT